MGGVDCGYQHRLMGAWFANIAHLKNWYKKSFLGLAGFSLLQGFTAWNLAVNSPDRPRIGGQPKSKELKKWEFYSIASEEMLTYVDNKEYQNFGRIQTGTPMHTPTPVPKNYHTKITTCMICSVEEDVTRRVKAFENKK